ncbi:hypothetical protein C8J57DRAFT_1216893 [Mycena rebaudengoi]|nr:hypothetical protein C8J57DRAFT_1216893 [Mycena rebaudengoi]
MELRNSQFRASDISGTSAAKRRSLGRICAISIPPIPYHPYTRTNRGALDEHLTSLNHDELAKGAHVIVVVVCSLRSARGYTDLEIKDEMISREWVSPTLLYRVVTSKKRRITSKNAAKTKPKGSKKPKPGPSPYRPGDARDYAQELEVEEALRKGFKRRHDEDKDYDEDEDYMGEPLCDEPASKRRKRARKLLKPNAAKKSVAVVCVQ